MIFIKEFQPRERFIKSKLSRDFLYSLRTAKNVKDIRGPDAILRIKLYFSAGGRYFILSSRWARVLQHWWCLRLQQLSYIKIKVNPYLGKGRTRVDEGRRVSEGEEKGRVGGARYNLVLKFSRVPAAVCRRPAAALELNAKTQPCVSCYLYSCRHYIPLPTASRYRSLNFVTIIAVKTRENLVARAKLTILLAIFSVRFSRNRRHVQT